MYSYEELEELCTEIQDRIIDGDILEILCLLNRRGELDNLLELLGINNHRSVGDNSFKRKKGKILVIGDSAVKENELKAVASNLGIDKSRFEFVLDYNKAKTYNFNKIKYSLDYSMIMVGPMPHSGNVKGKHSSIITAIENEDGYPPVVRVGNGQMKLSKSAFKAELKELMNQKKIA